MVPELPIKKKGEFDPDVKGPRVFHLFTGPVDVANLSEPRAESLVKDMLQPGHIVGLTWFYRNKEASTKVSAIGVSDGEKVVVLRTHTDADRVLPPWILAAFGNEAITKIVLCRMDVLPMELKKLLNTFSLQLDACKGWVSLAELAAKKGKPSAGLADLCVSYGYGLKRFKRTQFSNWDAEKLTEEQTQMVSDTTFFANVIYSKVLEGEDKPKKTLRKPVFVKISSLTPTSSGINVKAKVVSVKEITVGSKKGEMTMFEAHVANETGSVILRLTEEQKEFGEVDKTLIIRNARVMMYDGFIRIVVNKWGKIVVSDEAQETVELSDAKNISAVEHELVHI